MECTEAMTKEMDIKENDRTPYTNDRSILNKLKSNRYMFKGDNTF